MIETKLVNPKTEDGALGRRLRIMAYLCAGAFALLAARLWQLQVLQGEYYFRKSADNFVKDIEIPALRGEIRDRQGRVLAGNRAAYSIYVTPRFLSDEALTRLQRHLNWSDAEAATLRRRSDKVTGLRRYRAVLALEDISREQMARVATDRQNLPGVQIRATPRRTYPLKTRAAHLVGYINEISPAELAERRDQGYRVGDLVGRSGLERQWEGYLRGQAGFERIVVDARGRRKRSEEARELLWTARRRDPVPGNSIVLTLDSDLQRLVERAFRRYPSGAAAVVEADSGRILALASKPAFDPNVLAGRLTREEETKLNANPYRPRVDKTLREHYFPASTYKVVPALAALEEGLISPDEQTKCKGYHEFGRRWFRCNKVHGKVNLYEAVAQSCNVYFYKLAERVGMDSIAKYARELGLGVPTGLGLNGEVGGFIPTKAWYSKHLPGGFRLGYTLNAAIGQGSTKVTVLQLAMLYAAIANGGRLYMPQIVQRIETPAGATVQQFPPRLRQQVAVKPAHLEVLRRALAGVAHAKGTAYDARLKEIEVAGKTGTAQVRKLVRRQGEQKDRIWSRDHAWFAGFAPTYRPEIVVVVLVEHGGTGGHVAAPVAMEIIHGYFTKIAPLRRSVSQEGAAPNPSRSRVPALDDLPVPSARGLGAVPTRAAEH